MNNKTLYLAWQDKRVTRAWFPVGRLDVKADPREYRFRYTHGAERARNEAGFEPLFDFPKLNQSYMSSDLFPLFQNRVLSSGRTDFPEYLRMLDLPDSAEPAEILEVGGGSRATDNFEVFPKIERRYDNSFRCRFFLHGTSDLTQDAVERLDQLKSGEELLVAVELTHPVSRRAVQLQTTDHHMIGWAPRYLVNDLMQAMPHAPNGCKANVVRVNPAPAPSNQRLLVELTGSWPNYEPMSTSDFEPLVQ